MDGAKQAGERLKRTALRDFGPPSEDREPKGEWFKLSVPPDDVPVPRLWRYALLLIGLEDWGVGEKTAWTVDFTYRCEPCRVYHQKFGVRIVLRTTRGEAAAEETMREVAKKLAGSVRTVEKHILTSVPGLVASGEAIVVNQHHALERAYRYFRERATDPVHIDDVTETVDHGDGSRSMSFSNGHFKMRLASFHDMVAAISAYLSRIEHDLVLALPFVGFDPAADDLTAHIGARWGEKFNRILGTDDDVAAFKGRLTDIVERWRNPYSHGGFEKGQSATLYVIAPDVGAVPVGLSQLRKSPLFSFLPAHESDVSGVFDLFDQLDSWLRGRLPEATAWAESGLDVRFDDEFRTALAVAAAGGFEDFLSWSEARADMAANMDW